MENEKRNINIYFGKTTRKEEHRIVKILRKIHQGQKTIAEFPATEYNKKDFPRVQSLLRFELKKSENDTVFGTLITDFIVSSDKILIRLHPEAGQEFLKLSEDDLFFNPMRSKYSVLLFELLKSEDFNKNMTGILREEICDYFKLDTQQKISQFLMKLPLYIDELNQSGRLENLVTFTIDKEKGRRGHSPMKAIIFYFNKRKKADERPLKSPQSDDKDVMRTETPAAKQYTREDEGVLLCPTCGGRIVHCVAKSGKIYECCEHSKYNINVPVTERGQCKGYYKE